MSSKRACERKIQVATEFFKRSIDEEDSFSIGDSELDPNYLSTLNIQQKGNRGESSDDQQGRTPCFNRESGQSSHHQLVDRKSSIELVQVWAQQQQQKRQIEGIQSL